MLDNLTPSSFEEHAGTKFRLTKEGVEGSLDLELTQVVRHEEHPGSRRQPFSAFFRGPRNPVLPQSIYRLEHDPLGTLEIFLVPVGPDGQGMAYEAVFN